MTFLHGKKFPLSWESLIWVEAATFQGYRFRFHRKSTASTASASTSLLSADSGSYGLNWCVQLVLFKKSLTRYKSCQQSTRPRRVSRQQFFRTHCCFERSTRWHQRRAKKDGYHISSDRVRSKWVAKNEQTLHGPIRKFWKTSAFDYARRLPSTRSTGNTFNHEGKCSQISPRWAHWSK